MGRAGGGRGGVQHGGGGLCPYSLCLDPVCTKEHANEADRHGTLTQILGGYKLLRRKASKEELQNLLNVMHERLHMATADLSAPKEVRNDLRQMCDQLGAAKDDKKYLSNPDLMADPLLNAARKVGEGMTRVSRTCVLPHVLPQMLSVWAYVSVHISISV